MTQNAQDLVNVVLKEVIDEAAYGVLFREVEELRTLARRRRNEGDLSAVTALKAKISSLFLGLQSQLAHKAAAILTMHFDLDNLVEELTYSQSLQARRKKPEPEDKSIEKVFKEFREQGVQPGELREILENLRIEVILTAHPSENRRRTIMSKHQEIAAVLEEWHDPRLAYQEKEALRDKLKASIEGIWYTSRAREAKPTVEDEVRSTLFFVRTAFSRVIPRIYADMEQAVTKYYPGLLPPTNGYFFLGSWVGGDRDGHPLVTTSVTADALRRHCGMVLELYIDQLHTLERAFSISVDNPSLQVQKLLRNIDQYQGDEHFKDTIKLRNRYQREPYRVLLRFLGEKLIQAHKEDMFNNLLGDAPHSPRLLVSEITEILDAIENDASKGITKVHLRPFQRLVNALGRQGARLHIREDAEILRFALAELLTVLSLGLTEDTYECPELQASKADILSTVKILRTDGSALARTRHSADSHTASEYEQAVKLLSKWLQVGQLPTAMSDSAGITKDTTKTWRLFRLIARVHQIYGKELLGPFIISMTHTPIDVLTVLLLARWAHEVESINTFKAHQQEGEVTPFALDVAPLFETIWSLSDASSIMDELLELPCYRQHVLGCNNEQIIVLGYSDSNKDGGYLTANWKLYGAQTKVAEICRKHGIKFTLMHGRGGTVARGGGPTYEAILAQPARTINGRFSYTEQGEAISSHFLNPHLAYRQCEQILNAVLRASAPEQKNEQRPLPNEWAEAMEKMSSAATDIYLHLTSSDEFRELYWRRVTPIEEIFHLQLGSRPATRQAGSNKLKVRAIPWVFSWMQCRFNLPGWFGLGTGLSQVPLSLLREMYGVPEESGWRFLRTILDNAEMSLLKADMVIAEQYSSTLIRSEHQALAHRFFCEIQAEYERTVDLVLKVTNHSQLFDGHARIQASIEQRNPNVDPLNFIQIDALSRLYEILDPLGLTPSDEAPKALRKQLDPLHDVVALTINGVAAALRNTG